MVTSTLASNTIWQPKEITRKRLIPAEILRKELGGYGSVEGMSGPFQELEICEAFSFLSTFSFLTPFIFSLIRNVIPHHTTNKIKLTIISLEKQLLKPQQANYTRRK